MKLSLMELLFRCLWLSLSQRRRTDGVVGRLGLALMVGPVVALVGVPRGVVVGDLMVVTGEGTMKVMIKVMMIIMGMVVIERIMVIATMMIIMVVAVVDMAMGSAPIHHEEVAPLVVGRHVGVHLAEVEVVAVGLEKEVVAEAEEVVLPVEAHPVVEEEDLQDVEAQEEVVLPLARGSTAPTPCRLLWSIQNQSAGSKAKVAAGEASQSLSSPCTIVVMGTSHQTKSGTATVMGHSGRQDKKIWFTANSDLAADFMAFSLFRLAVRSLQCDRIDDPQFEVIWRIINSLKRGFNLEDSEMFGLVWLF